MGNLVHDSASRHSDQGATRVGLCSRGQSCHDRGYEAVHYIFVIIYDYKYQSFVRLPYVEATIAEVQRLGNVLPGSVPHKAVRDSYIGSKLIGSLALDIPEEIIFFQSTLSSCE